MTKAYGQPDSVSTAIRWRIILTVLIALIAGGTALTVLLALGLADPPRIGSLQWRASSPQGWPRRVDEQNRTFLDAPVELPDAFTLELDARNEGPSDSVWGIQLEGTEYAITILIDNQGYWSLSTEAHPHWSEFMHIQPGAVNRIALSSDEDGSATLQINEEMAWAGAIHATSWRVVLMDAPQLAWEGLALYDH